ncbi:MAG: hypothetical protein HGA42_00575 [Nostocales cyanobacterium W4_Combined_metabat2_030]|nr:hypothetical protein [Nostocales cyanobacterium W4_Combined_metabat2_030]
MITKETFRLKILYYTLLFEGGYCNIPGDRGGETYRGISQVHNPNWIGWGILSKLKPSNGDIINDCALKEAVNDYYFSKYFAPYRFDAITSELLALNLFDWVVNGGYSVEKIQILLRKYDPTIKVDGVFGFKTLSALNSVPAVKFCREVIALRQQYFDDIVENNPSQEKFHKGWCNRLTALKKLLKGL